MKLFNIVIPAYNEEKRIETVLRAIRKFKIDGYDIEVIMVDNGSEDTTTEVAKPYCDKIEIEPDYTIAGLRNHGAKIARGEYIGFIDSDCKPCADWARHAKEYLDNNPKIGIVGSYYGISERPHWIERAWFDMRANTSGETNFLPAGNCAVRKEEFLSIGGFSEKLITGEDYDLCERYKQAGFLIWNVPRLHSIHYGNPKNLTELFKKELWYGQSMLGPTRNAIFSKVFIAANVFLAGIFLICIGILTKLFGFSYSFHLTFYGIILIAFTSAAYTVVATKKSGKWMNIFFYFPIFLSYLSGRAASLFIIYSRKKRLKK